MTKKKMLILLLMLFTLGSTLTACGKKTETPAEKAASSTQPVSTEKPTQATEPENDITYTYSDHTLTIKGKGTLTSEFWEKNDLSRVDVKNVIILDVKNVIIENGITEIGEGAFSNCANLTAITIPDSVIKIGEGAFGEVAFGEGAFSDGTNLINVEVHSNNKNYSSEDGVLFDKKKTTLIYYPPKKTSDAYTIPDSVTEIGSRSFGRCRNLTTINIPDGVTKIGERAFSDCTNLINVEVHSNNKNYSSEDGVLFKATPHISRKILKPKKNTRQSSRV